MTLETKLIIRKKLVFIFNQAVDILNSSKIEAEQMYQLSNEVNHFKIWLDTISTDSFLKEQLQMISFSYTPRRAELSESFTYFFSYLWKWIVIKIQNAHRKKMLEDFLKKYDNLLTLLD